MLEDYNWKYTTHLWAQKHKIMSHFPPLNDPVDEILLMPTEMLRPRPIGVPVEFVVANGGWKISFGLLRSDFGELQCGVVTRCEGFLDLYAG